MKTTDNFKQVLEAELRREAFTDSQLAEALRKPHKNIKECCDYVLHTVKASGANGFASDEIFSMAKHYFFEDDVKSAPFTTSVQIVTNRHKKLSDQEIEKLKEQARKEVIEAEKKKMRTVSKKPVTAKDVEKKKNPPNTLF